MGVQYSITLLNHSIWYKEKRGALDLLLHNKNTNKWEVSNKVVQQLALSVFSFSCPRSQGPCNEFWTLKGDFDLNFSYSSTHSPNAAWQTSFKARQSFTITLLGIPKALDYLSRSLDPSPCLRPTGIHNPFSESEYLPQRVFYQVVQEGILNQVLIFVHTGVLCWLSRKG